MQPLEIRSLEGIKDEANIKLLERTLNLGTSAPTTPPPERSINAPDDTIIVDSGTSISHSVNLQLLSPEITLEPEKQ